MAQYLAKRRVKFTLLYLEFKDELIP